MGRILVCPVCKSADITLDTGGITGKYMCKKCGYIGSVVLELTEGEYKELLEGEKLEKEAERKDRNK
jgi:transposase-like protein